MVVGDANVDLEIRLPSGAVSPHANPDPVMFGGGSAANTAAALARLGHVCAFIGAVGDDSYGRFAVQSLEDAGVDVGYVQVVGDESTVTVITVVPPDGDRLIYVWPPRGGAHGRLQPVPASLFEGVSWLHVSGICLRVSPARETILATMGLARARGISVSLDLNLRLENWGWEDGFRDTILSAVAEADVVLGDAADEIFPLSDASDPVVAARALAGPDRLVIARRGAMGAVACSSTITTEESGYAVDVVDTVGAGDAFNAGFIAARTDGADLSAALQRGNAVAALTITRRGARSTPTEPELSAFMADQ